jgi:DNA-binding HxlR family transcriptional regulator
LYYYHPPVPIVSAEATMAKRKTSAGSGARRSSDRPRSAGSRRGVRRRPTRTKTAKRASGRSQRAARAGKSRTLEHAAEVEVSSFNERGRTEHRKATIRAAGKPAPAGRKPEPPTTGQRETLARQIARVVRPERLAQALAAVAHHQRIRILLTLLGGEATHQHLAKTTGLKAGPLYYHIRELRAAGLIGPPVRDLYTLTAKGRRALLAVLAFDKLVR